MNDLSLRQWWLADQIRAQTANAFAYPIDQVDRELCGQLRWVASQLMADVVNASAESIHESLLLDSGLRTPWWATAFAVETRDDQRRWFWEYLPVEPDLDQYLEEWGRRLLAERDLAITSIADSYSWGLPLPHTYVGWCPVVSGLTAVELEDVAPPVAERMSEALKSHVATDPPTLRTRDEALPTQLRRSVEPLCQRIIEICRAGLESSTDAYNRERYQYFFNFCAGVTFTENSSSSVESPWLRVSSPTTGAEAAILDQDHRILLMQRTDTGQWAMPGGACEVGEAAAATAVREAYEEIGVDLTVESLSTVVDNRLITVEQVSIDIIAIYLCRLSDPDQKPVPTNESLQAQWFSGSELDDLDFFHGHGIKVRRLLDQR